MRSPYPHTSGPCCSVRWLPCRWTTRRRVCQGARVCGHCVPQRENQSPSQTAHWWRITRLWPTEATRLSRRPSRWGREARGRPSVPFRAEPSNSFFEISVRSRRCHGGPDLQRVKGSQRMSDHGGHSMAQCWPCAQCSTCLQGCLYCSSSSSRGRPKSRSHRLSGTRLMNESHRLIGQIGARANVGAPRPVSPFAALAGTRHTRCRQVK